MLHYQNGLEWGVMILQDSTLEVETLSQNFSANRIPHGFCIHTGLKTTL
jgi:hypothetical protein